jgi:alkaline phosphatase D
VTATGALTRREAIALAAAMGASLAWPPDLSAGPRSDRPVERRDLFPQGVASGDPDAESVILWTRRPPREASRANRLTLEVSEREDFARLAARGEAVLSADTDWTCRVLAAGLRAGTVYWYRFIDDQGASSRTGRTMTAPGDTDVRPVRFVFVSCENHQLGACNAYRRMIWEDERAPQTEQIEFVMHLGDFFYELTWYPEDRAQMYSRTVRDIVRYPDGEKHGDFHVPTTLRDYRALYGAYLLDPDLQDARARWPFVCMADNHDFSWKGWQSQENFGQGVVPAQTRKVAANQTWFEYHPSRAVHPGSGGLSSFDPPVVSDAPIHEFDDDGLGLESGNLAAIRSLRRYRGLHWGRNVDLLLTDNRTYRSEPLTDRPELAQFRTADFPAVVSQDITEVLDAGRAYRGGHPPATIRFSGADLPNPRKDSPPLSMLGGPQKKWFLDCLRSSRATWKLWGNSVAMLDWRTDFQNLPESVPLKWPTSGYAVFGDDDWSGYRYERGELLRAVRDERITGLVTLCGDRHAFLAGLLAADPEATDPPVAAEFVTGSISAPGLYEAFDYGIPETHPLRPIFVYANPEQGVHEPAINLSMTCGVRASLALSRTHDLASALRETNPDVARDIAFADVGGHGYAMVRADPDRLAVEFVGIARPVDRTERPDGGPVVYRITHQVDRWSSGQVPRLARTLRQGALPLGSVNPSKRFASAS